MGARPLPRGVLGPFGRPVARSGSATRSRRRCGGGASHGNAAAILLSHGVLLLRRRHHPRARRLGRLCLLLLQERAEVPSQPEELGDPRHLLRPVRALHPVPPAQGQRDDPPAEEGRPARRPLRGPSQERLEADTVISEALGDHVLSHYVEAKRPSGTSTGPRSPSGSSTATSRRSRPRRQARRRPGPRAVTSRCAAARPTAAAATLAAMALLPLRHRAWSLVPSSGSSVPTSAT